MKLAERGILAAHIPLAVAIERPQRVDLDEALVRAARGLGISFGDR